MTGMSGIKVGLALGGGAARGWAHIGVLKALAKAGIVPDIIAGTSIGAVVGGCYSAGHLDDLERWAIELTPKRIFGYLDFNLAGTGLISGQRLCGRLEQHLGGRNIEDLGTRFTAVATEVGTGHEHWLSRGRLVDAVRASYALPGVFKPVKINGRWLFDGALVNPIPVSVCRALGARYVIAVNLNFDILGRGSVISMPETFYADEDDQLHPAVQEGKPERKGVRALLQRQIFGRGDGAPGISTVMVDAFNIVQDRIARSRLAGDPPDAMVSPRLQDVGLFDFHRAEETIERGSHAVERQLDDIIREIETRDTKSGPGQRDRARSKSECTNALQPVAK
ncbi:patatin-like phospholipase family protein [Hyphomicrobium sp.]|jgi:NTE family protein|uniref:patatin-like phospholipase family protein n=1 Tax=Hyphomicrobium sp. TaxID=82 RepID=UPI002B55BD2B|nr:patatin-like phospholipase family protein [Hyphomicrobium sp.]HVZ05334.1 patatin-like phospholipase family protein [Hyphomicrobium sp.]